MEILVYGENGIATITFKNGKIESYNNYDKILKIGSNKKESKNMPEDDIFKKMAKASKEDTHGLDTGTSFSGLGAGDSL